MPDLGQGIIQRPRPQFPSSREANHIKQPGKPEGEEVVSLKKGSECLVGSC